MTKPGLSIESAASVILHKAITDHMHTFAHVVQADYVAGKSVHAEYVNGLAGCIALMVVGGQGNVDDIVAGTATKLIECINRDLRLLSGARLS